MNLDAPSSRLLRSLVRLRPHPLVLTTIDSELQYYWRVPEATILHGIGVQKAFRACCAGVRIRDHVTGTAIRPQVSTSHKETYPFADSLPTASIGRLIWGAGKLSASREWGRSSLGMGPRLGVLGRQGWSSGHSRLSWWGLARGRLSCQSCSSNSALPRGGGEEAPCGFAAATSARVGCQARARVYEPSGSPQGCSA